MSIKKYCLPAPETVHYCFQIILSIQNKLKKINVPGPDFLNSPQKPWWWSPVLLMKGEHSQSVFWVQEMVPTEIHLYIKQHEAWSPSIKTFFMFCLLICALVKTAIIWMINSTLCQLDKILFFHFWKNCLPINDGSKETLHNFISLKGQNTLSCMPSLNSMFNVKNSTSEIKNYLWGALNQAMLRTLHLKGRTIYIVQRTFHLKERTICLLQQI